MHNFCRGVQHLMHELCIRRLRVMLLVDGANLTWDIWLVLDMHDCFIFSWCDRWISLFLSYCCHTFWLGVDSNWSGWLCKKKMHVWPNFQNTDVFLWRLWVWEGTRETLATAFLRPWRVLVAFSRWQPYPPFLFWVLSSYWQIYSLELGISSICNG